MSTVEKEPVSKGVVIRPFVIEADGKRNNDILLQNIPNARLRSRIISTRTVKDAKTGKVMVPKDQAVGLGALPEIPGMRISVNPAKLEAVITDPLHDNEDLCDTIRQFMESSEAFMSVGTEIRGVDTRKEKLTEDSMKTLCRELIWLVDSEDARVHKGTMPTLEDVENLPGHFLLNPGSVVPNSQPAYEKDLDDWRQRIAAGGG